ncbi:alpha/beta hydrolase [Mucilaginibacter conchicola]|uniref:Alpha/beta hydrolase n=1 Tax=Mucilaginibacter conchicola TaxID=2303333 RepID=A0A372NPU2_9SPHI|nr:alpha/beta hydrolase [Mucilaginibacter conchicola]RFZ90941.1 alpha/beta hydrolase [Mucilaginibacter conchicola]
MEKQKNLNNADSTCLTATTRLVEVNGRSLAYRVIGKGPALVLCNRFKGNLDTWDPAFIDALARHLQVILFDYTGIGHSTGKVAVSDIPTTAKDVKDLLEGLNLSPHAVGGWSYGGMVAQTFFALYPDYAERLVLIGTPPPGDNPHPVEKVFYEVAVRENDLNDDYIAFFEPRSELSRELAAASRARIKSRETDLDIPVPEPVFKEYFEGGKGYRADELKIRDKIIKHKKPIFLLMGDHDVCFAVENWYALNQQLAHLQLVVLPQAGHAPQHQYPDISAGYISQFLLTDKF